MEHGVRNAALVLIACLVLVSPAYAQMAEPCGDLENHYGPFDYRTDKGR